MEADEAVLGRSDGLRRVGLDSEDDEGRLADEAEEDGDGDEEEEEGDGDGDGAVGIWI